MSTVNNLLATINSSGGLVRPNYFDVRIPTRGIGTNENSYTILSCSVPSRNVLTGEYNPSTPMKKYANGVEDEDISIVFRLTNDFRVYDICMDWIETVSNPSTFTKGYKKDVAEDAFITILDSQHRAAKRFKLINSFPINITNIELSNESENQIATFGITLTYDYFLRM